MPAAPALRLARLPALSRLGPLAVGAAVLGGCRADYSADLRNMTPQPVFAQIYQRGNDGNILLASSRLGPGDRALVGPVRAEVGKAGLIVDTKPNPEGLAYLDLRPGISVFNIHQRGAATGGPLTIEEVTDNR